MGREDLEPEGITWVNNDVEDVVQGGHQDEYDVHTISTICTRNVSFVSNINNRKMKTSMIWEALRISKAIFNPLRRPMIILMEQVAPTKCLLKRRM